MHILIVRNNFNSQAIDASLLLAAYLTSHSIEYSFLDSGDINLENPDCSIAVEPELAVVLGGDGTILRTAGLMRLRDVPILGINFGRLGFLANSSDAGVIEIVSAALAGDVTREERSNLRIDVVCEEDNEDEIVLAEEPFITKEGERRSFFALNEVTVNRGDLGRAIDFSLRISDSKIAELRGDGIIVATSTGSTAYALSAGGPLVTPSYSGLVVVPLAPHSLRSRTIVTAPNDIVEIDLTENDRMREAVFFIDGEKVALTQRPLKAFVRKGPRRTTLLHYKCDDFYTRAASVFFD